ncbi:hypothetical protein V5N11_010123 [Cardamine amara subsp. amara]|uniref:Uncharacterized protein n=1 Tax=Cardamine amara subsp. amara TaxID=228776 RepID=A0ABD1C0I7_CARAN
MELLAFEAIPSLKNEYRIDVASMKDCPRMCQRKFKPSGDKGYPLSKIKTTLGKSKDISSTLEVSLREDHYLVSRIGVKQFERDDGNPIARGMMAQLGAGKRIFWKALYDQDVATRAKKKKVAKVGEEEQHGSEDARAEENLHNEEEKEEEHASENAMAEFLRESKEEMQRMRSAMLNFIDMSNSVRDLVMVTGGRLTNFEETLQRLQKGIKGKEKVEEVFEEVDLTRGGWEDASGSGGDGCDASGGGIGYDASGNGGGGVDASGSSGGGGDASGSGGGGVDASGCSGGGGGDASGSGGGLDASGCDEDGVREEQPITEPIGSWAMILAPPSPRP